MPGQFGNKGGGRGTARQEAEKILNMNLANAIGNQELKRIKQTPIVERKREDLKEIVMPIVLKGIKEVADYNIKFEKPILGGEYVHRNFSNKKDRKVKSKDSSLSGGDRSEQNDFNSLNSD